MESISLRVPRLSRWTPTKRRDLVRKLRALGFEGPFSGGSYQYMVRGHARLPVPSYDELSVDMTRRLLREVELRLGRSVELEEWERL